MHNTRALKQKPLNSIQPSLILLFIPMLFSTAACQNDIHEKGILYSSNSFLFSWFLCGCLHEFNILRSVKCWVYEGVSMLLCVQPQSMAEVLAKKEELADRLEKANEEAIASAIAEEEQLTREIQAENNDLETDNESDFSVRLIILTYTAHVKHLCLTASQSLDSDFFYFVVF